ncbi:DUF2871 domain-containing protein [Clostridium gasigenes]|uniref:DUF2871 domain-containing protein n=1 Tax=Clostridium gasigenes TaxID=94869 RepID=A0A1H0U7S0_9CLOT|nr:DUF2871 domain-containing protein [Clostridium gasigenes]MBB6625672.1 DUF2871 domain-containing protein [Clostridium gasigenes]MBU3090435.1 DUF2871 domain-containing protein [Clostridium gasigenes]SDP62204.1 Protein of unknown function [Clostridium gasigenes]
MKKYLNLSMFYLVLGLVLGVFYREFTKINGFEGQTVLGAVHSHVLVLGFLFFLIVLLLEKNFKISEVKHFGKWLIFHNVALIYMLSTLVARGILQVTGKDFSGLSHIAGLSHAIFGISLVWFMVILKKSIK